LFLVAARLYFLFSAFAACQPLYLSNHAICRCQLHPGTPPYIFSFIFVFYSQDKSRPFLFSCCFPLQCSNYLLFFTHNFSFAFAVRTPAQIWNGSRIFFWYFRIYLFYVWMLEYIDTYCSCSQSHKCNPIFATPSLTITPSRPGLSSFLQCSVQTPSAYGGRNT